jgi:CBS domain-containing protein
VQGKLRAILEGKGRQVFGIGPEETVAAAVEALDAAGVGALLVKDGERIVGILSERDIVRRVLARRLDPAATRVKEVMTREVVAVGLEVGIDEAMAVVTEKRCRHLPVVDHGALVGVVSSGDLTRWAIRDREFQIAELVNFITGKYPA